MEHLLECKKNYISNGDLIFEKGRIYTLKITNNDIKIFWCDNCDGINFNADISKHFSNFL